MSDGPSTSSIRPAPDQLSARSVIASTLLGTEPPRLSASRLVRVGALFGLSDGTVRTALSRMASNGELTKEAGGWYALAGDLAGRQLRQSASRSGVTVEWSGRWRQAVVVGSARSAPERSGLRRAMQQLRLGELREGVWLRPDNLDPQPLSGRPDGGGRAVPLVRRPPRRRRRPGGSAVGPRRLVGDRDGPAPADGRAWSAVSRTVTPRPWRPGFVLSASVLRHFNADPLLPRELSGRRWPGARLRSDYDRYDLAYRRLLRHLSRRRLSTHYRCPGE